MHLGIHETHQALKNRFIDYLKSQYLGPNTLLQNACKDIFEKPGMLYQEPYIEASPAYVIENNGLERLQNVPKEIQAFLLEMAELGLGVYKNPYKHQVESIEAFYKGKDLFVSTGTGSGKTECFMWPMISHIAYEAFKHPDSWENEGIRAVILYPMNALVSDQLGRLRRMIGDTSGKFRRAFFKHANNNLIRIPKFGMYTGRTPYPGRHEMEEDKKLARTLSKTLIHKEPKVIERLMDIGKYPAKYDLETFVQSLSQGNHDTHPWDAELMTRFEMHQICPDILITNYSMLEFMLLRPIEDVIWRKTKKWLHEKQDNRLLIILDEAHMYKGSAGGEVALLIRRLLNKLDITRDKARFILTTASVPKNRNLIQQFACRLTAQPLDSPSFEIIFGEQQKIDLTSSELIEADPKVLIQLRLENLQGNEYQKLNEIERYSDLINDRKTFQTLDEARIWLYHKLSQCKSLMRIVSVSRGDAKPYKDICKQAFPDAERTVARKATDILLTLATLAKNENEQVLFPVRLHMMFRGLQGLYACCNPNCKDANSGDGIRIGKIYFGHVTDTCESCGSKVFQLVSDRRCGALFLQGYVQLQDSIQLIWNTPGLPDEYFLQIHLYIVPDFYQAQKNKKVRLGWLHVYTGKFIDYDPPQDKQHEYLKVAYYAVDDAQEDMEFATCPKCESKLTFVSDFITKGNESFYNLVSEQLRVQPPTLFSKEELENNPNAGRKVLLFSDSRQRAATLAKDLTRAADDEAARKVMVIAAKRLLEWSEQNGEEPTMNLLYVTFLSVAAEHKLQLFYGDDKEKFREHLDTISKLESKDRKKYRNWKEHYLKTEPGLYNEQLLKLMCNYFHSLSDIALCYVWPDEEFYKDDIEDVLKDGGVNITQEDFCKFFSAWANHIMKDSYALGDNIKDDVRKNIRTAKIKRYGVKPSDKPPKYLREILDDQGYSSEQINKIFECLFMFTNEQDKKRYLNLNSLVLKTAYDQKWYRCQNCAGIYAFTLWGKCVHCGRENVKVMSDEEMKSLDFWRKPVLETLADPTKPIASINTEEHTAQLSHKDQRDKMWSTTEEYELRFQNVYADNNEPIDILSCTTTMEVGIDIGSLVAVGMRNIPPMRENYQQRAGRAGRRGASIATIVTYTEDGPHDNYYFNDPTRIISGDPRVPWVDTANEKLIRRHFSMVLLNKYLYSVHTSLDQLAVTEYFDKYHDGFKHFIQTYDFSKLDIKTLIPEDSFFSTPVWKDKIRNDLDELQSKVKNNEYDYKNPKGDPRTLLEVLQEEGLLPTYSFPRDVVGFYIEDETGHTIEQKPERSLDIAISEYAPGKVVVVNKKTYKSGGIYSSQSKFRTKYYEKPALPYFENENYFKTVYICGNRYCGWFSLAKPKHDTCPLCNEMSIEEKNIIKPWGFAPLNAKSIPESEAEIEYSYSEEPSYSHIPSEEEMKKTEYRHIRMASQKDQPLTILNLGADQKGFQVCRLCGAATTGKDKLSEISAPYVHPYSRKICNNHQPVNVVLGHTFHTDMVLYEFSLNPDVINTKLDRLWLKGAVVTLAEAMVLAAGRMLDIEFLELRRGYRIRQAANGLVAADIFLYDSLTSGAGYSAEIANRTKDLFAETINVLDCTCDFSCHNCLNHFWNQRVQKDMNRHAALQLLKWGMNGELVSAIDRHEQQRLFMPLKKLLELNDNMHVQYKFDGTIWIEKDGIRKHVEVYPSMWNFNFQKTNGVIRVSDMLLSKALPSAYNQLIAQMYN